MHPYGVCRDHRARPSAREALQHSWLQASLGDRGEGKPIDQAIVQRLQVSPAPQPHCSICSFQFLHVLSELVQLMDHYNDARDNG